MIILKKIHILFVKWLKSRMMRILMTFQYVEMKLVIIVKSAKKVWPFPDFKLSRAISPTRQAQVARTRNPRVDPRFSSAWISLDLWSCIYCIVHPISLHLCFLSVHGATYAKNPGVFAKNTNETRNGKPQITKKENLWEKITIR